MIVLRYLEPNEFEAVKKVLRTVTDDFDSTEENGFTITVGEQTIILINDNPTLSDDEKKIVLWHEKAHAAGVKNEEEADRWALKHLSKTQKAHLIRNWPGRHGHSYR